jgi:hypothetical protein
MGVRVDMGDESHWFHSFKHGSWTRHWRGIKTCGCGLSRGCGFADCPREVNHQETYTEAKLLIDYTNTPERRRFLRSLFLAVQVAMEA